MDYFKNVSLHLGEDLLTTNSDYPSTVANKKNEDEK